MNVQCLVKVLAIRSSVMPARRLAFATSGNPMNLFGLERRNKNNSMGHSLFKMAAPPKEFLGTYAVL
jgi:hypothetical protein